MTRCAYCSLNGLRTGINSSNNVQPNSIRYIEKFFYKRKTGMERTLIDQRSPIQIGVSSDPLQPAEKQFHVTLRVLKILQDRHYPTVITTKFSNQLTAPRYLQAIEGLPLAVQCSVSTEDPAMLQRLEPGAPSLKSAWQPWTLSTKPVSMSSSACGPISLILQATLENTSRRGPRCGRKRRSVQLSQGLSCWRNQPEDKRCRWPGLPHNYSSRLSKRGTVPDRQLRGSD